MKKGIKIILLSIAVLLVMFILYLNYQTHFSSKAKEGKINIQNIKKVEKGMSADRIISIMGNPDTTIPPDAIRYPYTQYNYETNDESFANVTVVFDSTMKVKETYYPKK